MESESDNSNADFQKQPRRKRKKSSPVWDDFIESEEEGEIKRTCRACGSKFSPKTSTSTLKAHLKTHINNEEDTNFAEKSVLTLLVDWVICDLQPFTAVENSYFKQFSKVISKNSVNIPSADTIKNHALFRYDSYFTKVKKELKNSQSKVNLIADIWTKNVRSFLGIAAQWVKDFTVKNILIDMIEIEGKHSLEI